MINQILADTNRPDEVITVGTPATFLSYSDRSPGVVVAIIDEKTIEIAWVDCKAKPNPNRADDIAGISSSYPK